MTKKDQTYELLLRRINSGEYPAQAYIDEKAVAKELNTSRTPVREAILSLAQEGYLKVLPQRGIIVLPFTYEDACDIFQTRKLLEPWLIRTYGPTFTEEELLAERKLVEQDAEIHRNAEGIPGISMMHHPHVLLIRRCQNQFIANILQHVERQCNRIPNERYRTTPYTNSKTPEEVRETHMILLELMLQKRFGEAEAEMVHHVELAEEEYMRYWFQA